MCRNNDRMNLNTKVKALENRHGIYCMASYEFYLWKIAYWLRILSLETTGVVRGSYFYKARTIFLPPLGFHLHMEMYILQFSD